MQLECILTFDKKEQEIFSCDILPEALKSKTTLLDFIFNQLTQSEKAELVKISCCLYGENKTHSDIPQWYILMNGKYWLDDLEGYRRVKNIKSSIDPEYVTEWLNNNNETLKMIW
jgi:hypothetical protein